MSRADPRRRRRSRRRKTALAGSPYELFMDPITCTMGVVMFVFLMVVLFGRTPDAVALTDAAGTQHARELREERDELTARVAALPPAGDPALIARWQAAFGQLKSDRMVRDGLERAILQRTLLATAERSAVNAADAQLKELQARVVEMEARAAAPKSGFVRVSRFQADPRRAVILALNAGQISRPVVTAKTESIAPPTQGAVLGDAVQARAVLSALLKDSPPNTHRVELVVWADSFAQAKAVEQVLLEMGYDTNPLPVVAGAALTPGTGGVQ